MTYARKPARRRRPGRAGLSGLADMVDDTIGQIETSQCLAQANQFVAPIDAKIDDLAKNWQTTGLYTPQMVRDIVQVTMSVIQRGQTAIDQARSTPNASQESTMRATNDLVRAGGRSLDFLDAAREADAQGIPVIEAQSLKRWVTDSLASASSAMVTASVIGCLKPWWVAAIALFQATFDVAWSTIKRIAGIVLAVGQTVLKVADDLAQLYEYLKWGAIIGGGYWLWIQLHNLRRSGRSIL